MLRALVLALVLANLVYLVWVQGLLAPYGFAPASQAEPERLEQQIRPDAVELLPAPPAQLGASAPASAFTPGAAASTPASAPAVPASAVAPASTPSAPASAPATPGAAASVPAASAAASTLAASAAARPVASTASSPVASAASRPVASVASRPAAAAASKPADAAVVPVAARKGEPETGKSAAESRKSPPEEPTQCLQAGLFTEAQVSAMRSRLQTSLPAGSWTFVSGNTKPTRWIVYMGKYVNKEALNKKRKLLEQANVDFETPASPQLNPGLSLGSYKTKAQAEAALAKLNERGIRSAKVVQEFPEQAGQWLRLPSAGPALQTKAKTVVPQISGKPLKACS